MHSSANEREQADGNTHTSTDGGWKSAKGNGMLTMNVNACNFEECEFYGELFKVYIVLVNMKNNGAS